MSRAARLTALGALIGYALAAPASAQDGASRSAKQRDPNERVCEKQEVLGSRLAVKRICMTRAEWVEHRRANRDLVQNTQMGVLQKNPCNRSGC
jgi:hypothetical protein